MLILRLMNRNKRKRVRPTQSNRVDVEAHTVLLDMALARTALPAGTRIY